MGLAGAAAADEVVNSDPIVILSDDVRKTSTEVVHSGSAATSDPPANPPGETAVSTEDGDEPAAPASPAPAPPVQAPPDSSSAPSKEPKQRTAPEKPEKPKKPKQ